jgi:hypothetical protein
MGAGQGVSEPEFSEYCRQVETYLCRKNQGHLIRIVGPAFEQVRGWAERGVPLSITLRGIDQYCERQQGKGPRRRPVRIEFCEADILDLFDAWRRAVGVNQAAAPESGPAPRKLSLAAHIERVVARLTTARTGQISPAFSDRIAEIVPELDRLGSEAASARGERRAEIVARLDALDRQLIEAAVAELAEADAIKLRGEAAQELAPFLPRLDDGARAKAIEAAFGRLAREAFKLPMLHFD